MTQGEALKIGVLVSGSGSNLQAIIDAIDTGKLNVQIVKVISSRPDAYGLVRAEKAGIPILALNKQIFRDPAAANTLIAQEFSEVGAQYIVMAGYMRILGGEVLQAFPDRVLNLHPAVLPAFKGANAIEEAFRSGVKLSGITVHFANAEYDKGPIVAQKAVEIFEDDTLESFEARMHAAEHQLYPEVLQLVAEGRVSVDEKRRVCISS